MNLNRIEEELKKRLCYPYRWGRKQSNDWDNQTNFIYRIDNFNDLLNEISKFNDEIKNYAMNRWYNLMSAKAVEYIFASYPNVIPNKNQYDKLVDFQINNISFDHKTSIFPKGFNQPFKYAKQNPIELIKWLYRNQSHEGRQHFKNRLFIILYDSQHMEHWKLKSEISLLQDNISNYINNFSRDRLYRLKINNEIIETDIIWVIR